MQKSESIKELATALAKAQGEFQAVKKDCENPFFKSSYADLASVVATVKPVMAKYGLSVCQLPSLGAKGPIVTTVLLHSSGEWLSSELEVPAVKPDAQGIGSALTYGRRYALSAILGVASEDDDDGNRASHDNYQPKAKSAPRAAESAKSAPPQPSPPPSDEATVTFPAPEIMGNEISGTVVSVRRATPKTGKGQYLQIGIAGHRSMVCFDPHLFNDLEAIKKPTPAVLKFTPSGKPGSFPDSVTEIVSINGKQPELERLGISQADTEAVPF